MDPYYLTLNVAEAEMIAEVKAATRAAGFSEEEHLDVIGEVTDFNDAISMAQNYLRKFIKFCKSLAAFCAFPPDDQLIVLKAFFSEMLILQIAYMFKPEWGAIPGIASEDSTERVLVNFNLLSHSNKADWTFYLLQRCTYAHAEFEGDPLIRDLIATILLFQQRDGLSCPEYACFQYWRYYWLGNRYLEQKYSNPAKAMAKVKVFLDLKQELGFFKQILESLFLEDATELPMLLSEVFSK